MTPPVAVRRTVQVAALYAIGGGLLTLFGWATGIARLTDWKGDGIVMFPNPSVCIASAGAALLLQWSRSVALARALAVLITTTAALTLAEHITGFDLGIDRLLVNGHVLTVAAASPMRMGPPASTSLLLIGGALLLLTYGARERAVASALGLVAMAIALLSVTGHLYGAQQMYTMPRLTGIALQTASMVLALSIGVVASVPERDPMRAMLEKGSAGILARRTLPVLIVIALALGWARVTVQNQGLVDMAFGTALRTLVEIALLVALLWRALSTIRAHEKKIAESEASMQRHAGQLGAFLDTAPIGLERIGADGTILWANDAELAMLGYERDEYVGHPVTEFHVDDNVIADIRERLAHGQNVLDQSARMRCRDGSIKSVLIDASALWDDGRFLHMQSFVRDVTAQVRADETRALLAAIVDASDDAIVSKTTNGIITSWNPGACRLFGYTAEEAVGKSIELIIPPDRLAEEQLILGRIRRGESIDHFETIRRRKNGVEFHVALTVSPVRDASGRIIGASKIARDITDRKRADAEREEASRRKDEFIAILAHELRNPLAPVRNAAAYLKEVGGSELARPVEMIERQISQMARLIDDLLDVSRISRGVLELRRERIDLSEILEAAVDATHGEIEAKSHVLKVDAPRVPIELDADRERLVQVLSNLLNNAAKYTPMRGDIRLQVHTRGAMLEISVKDDGIGIPPDKVGSIFELFVRVDDSLERQGGLGIGLTLARQIVELHGGTIEARSDGIGCGTEFLVQMPVVVTAKAVRREASNGAQARRVVPRRVLVADDNHDAAESLSMLLSLAGHDVRTAFDGEAALRTAADMLPDVALLDIGMPRANGYEVAREIRKEPWGRSMILVALTGWGQESDKERAREAGFDTHLLKPVAPEIIEELLEKLPHRAPV